MPPLFLALSYVAGAIPFGVIIARVFYHTDIRNHGSRNTGATNVWRVLGAKPGLATFLLDFLKGFLPVVLAKHFFSNRIEGDWMPVAAGVASIIGHNWSVFLKGSGGKGVASSAGVFIALMPVLTAYAVGAFAVVFLTTKRISVGSMAAAVTLVGSSFLVDTPFLYRLVAVLCSLMILIKHIPNMKRLVKGEEPKVKLR